MLFYDTINTIDQLRINKNNMNVNNNKKKEVLKLLKTIGIDTRFISYTDEAIYINDQRFSKFSKKRQETFRKYHPEMKVISSTLLQKICIRASKVLSSNLFPKDKILLLKPVNNVDTLLKIVLEPYSRKYGVSIIESEKEYLYQIDNNLDIDKNNNSNIDLDIKEDIDVIVKSLTLDEKVEDILSNIFSGNGIGNISKEKNEKFKVIYPFINIPKDWIDVVINEVQSNYKNSFEINDNNIDTENNAEKKAENCAESHIIAKSFMEFLDNIIPQYKENLLKSSVFIENKLIENK